MKAFAHDLHAYFTTGYPLPTSQGSSRLRPVKKPVPVVTAEAA
jgi:hypothetical protein